MVFKPYAIVGNSVEFYQFILIVMWMRNRLLLRFFIFILGLFTMSFGVVLSVKANLGVSPISCVPYIFSLRFPVTLGITTIVLNIFLVVLQMIVLKKDYRVVQLIQIPVVFLFGYFIDLQMFWLTDWVVSGYLWKLFYCLLSCVILATGVFLEVKAKLTYLPGEGFAMAISEKFGFDFGKSKIGTDSTLVVIGIISSFLLLRSIIGVREGTIFSALLVGFLTRLYGKKFSFIEKRLSPQTVEPGFDIVKVPIVGQPFSYPIITISREFGSGGHEIGKLVAKKLGISFFDKELIQFTAEEGGFTQEYIKKNEQRLASTLAYTLYDLNYAYCDEVKPPLDALFMVQSKVIREIAEQGACVIVGRCANYILKNHKNCFNVFVQANMPFRKNRALNNYGISFDNSDKILDKTDRERENYCKRFTGRSWKDIQSYHLVIDSSSVGIEIAADLIVEGVTRMLQQAK